MKSQLCNRKIPGRGWSDRCQQFFSPAEWILPTSKAGGKCRVIDSGHGTSSTNSNHPSVIPNYENGEKSVVIGKDV